jgi:hypothetical protein
MIYALDVCTGLNEFNESVQDIIPGFPDVSVGVCEWGSGSSWLAASIILYFGAGFLLCCTPQPDPICK